MDKVEVRDILVGGAETLRWAGKLSQSGRLASLAAALDAGEILVPKFKKGDRVLLAGEHTATTVREMCECYTLTEHSGLVMVRRLSPALAEPPVRRPVPGEWWTATSGRIYRFLEDGRVQGCDPCDEWRTVIGHLDHMDLGSCFDATWRPLPPNHVPVKAKDGKIEIREICLSLGVVVLTLWDGTRLYQLAGPRDQETPLWAALADGFDLELHQRLWKEHA